MDALDEIVAEFLVESYDNLDQLDRDLLALEQDPSSTGMLASVFRTIHTIKGTSGFLAFHHLEKVTHVGESLLSKLRDGHIALNEERSTALLRMVDTIRTLLASIEQTGTEDEVPDLADLIEELSRLVEDSPAVPASAGVEVVQAGVVPEQRSEEPVATVEPAAATAAPAGRRRGTRRAATAGRTTAARTPEASDGAAGAGAGADDAGADAVARTGDTRPAKAGGRAASGRSGRSRRATAAIPDGVVAPAPDAGSTPAPDGVSGAVSGPDASPPLGEVLVQAGAVSPDAVNIARMEQDLGDDRRIGAILVDHGEATPRAVATALETQDARRSVVDSSVRVDVELLDSLMRLVGELVLARNQLVSRLDDARDSALARSAQRLSIVTSELQEQVMKTRMQPVDAVWSKLPRVVRDLAKQCGRRVRLEMEGRETELDRSVLEAIKDPLTHLVRNAVDHGIEPPDVRRAAGKDPEGVLRLRAYHEAGQVHLEIIDDGAGIDPARVAAKALERNLVTPARLAEMGPTEIIQLVFVPGFSTATGITNVSGRGVGMDVVKTRIESIGGSVDVGSRVGQGTVCRLTIPLTLAIIPALTIGCAGRRYAVPQVSVLELVRLAGEHARGGIEFISGAPVYRLRDMLLPLVCLDEQLGLQTACDDGGEGADREVRGGFIVVLQAEQRRFGLVVDDVLETQEIVVKPLGRHLKGIPVYAGATILGDGSVVLILDAATLARRANVLNGGAATASESLPVETEAVEPVLVVEVGGSRRAAIPLSMVTRLEEIDAASIERVGGREVVQYRGHIMPLVRLASLLGAYGESEAGDRVQMVVYTQGERSVGFVVERIFDIATERSGTRSDVDDHALMGSVVVGEHVVELLDVRSAILAADPNFFDERSGSQGVDLGVTRETVA
jgi:two-component system chemotaxis sensor kinase CheA